MDEVPYPSTSPHEQFLSDVLPAYHDFLAEPQLKHREKAVFRALADFAEHAWYYYSYHQDGATIGDRGKAETFVKYLAEKHSCPELLVVWESAKVGKHRFNTPPGRLRAIREGGATSITAIMGSTGPVAATGPIQQIYGDTDGEPEDFAQSETVILGHGMFAGDVFSRVIAFWQDWLLTAPKHT